MIEFDMSESFGWSALHELKIMVKDALAEQRRPTLCLQLLDALANGLLNEQQAVPYLHAMDTILYSDDEPHWT